MVDTTSSEGFTSPLDIANRACQHVGVTRISGFDEDSKQASEIGFVYDKVRRAELRRNVWRFAIRRATIRPIDHTTLLVKADPWAATTVYQRGAFASFGGVMWVSLVEPNVSITPGTDVGAWDAYFGPLTATPFDSTIAYNSGELVYKSNGSGKTYVFANQYEGNANDPYSAEQYSATKTYGKGHTVQFEGFFYRSLIDVNLGNVPATYPMYNATTTYAANTIISGYDGNLYMCMFSGTLGIDPVGNPASWYATGWPNPWTPTFSGTSSGNGWVRQAVSISQAKPVYPVGSGPASDTLTRYVFRLPQGFLRQAPEDPKAGSVAFLGAPTGQRYNDWNLEGNYITSGSPFPITLRFVADVTYVPAMDDMFCEGFGARIALEVCEVLTQAQDKLRAISGEYNKFMGEARTVNGIETGPTEPFEDEWLEVRI